MRGCGARLAARRPSVAALCGRRPFRSLLVAAVEPLELLDRVDDVGDVEEAVALEADVNERRLHAGQHLRHPALVDVADDAALPLALDEDLDDQVVLEDGHPRLVAVRGDDHLLVHSQTPPQADSDSGIGSVAASCPMPGARILTPIAQFVNLRIRTLSTRPNPASVAIIDDPP